MSGHKSRITQLERALRRQERPARGHVTPVVRVPHDVPRAAWDAWLASQPCACGRRGCPERKIGVLLPQKCATPDEGAQHHARGKEPHGHP